jgi:hypothetical protein
MTTEENRASSNLKCCNVCGRSFAKNGQMFARVFVCFEFCETFWRQCCLFCCGVSVFRNKLKVTQLWKVQTIVDWSWPFAHIGLHCNLSALKLMFPRVVIGFCRSAKSQKICWPSGQLSKNDRDQRVWETF